MAKKYRSWSKLMARRSKAGGPPRLATVDPHFWAQCQLTVAQVAARSEYLQQTLSLADGDVPVIVAVCPEAIQTCEKLGIEDEVAKKNLLAWRSTEGNVRNWLFLALGAAQVLEIMKVPEKHQQQMVALLETRDVVVVIGADGVAAVRLIEGKPMPQAGRELVASIQP